jgi:hypothetical protein
VESSIFTRQTGRRGWRNYALSNFLAGTFNMNIDYDFIFCLALFTFLSFLSLLKSCIGHIAVHTQKFKLVGWIFPHMKLKSSVQLDFLKLQSVLIE